MTIRNAGLALACAAVLAAFPAAAQQKRRGPAPDVQAETERLNEESLQRARQGQNSPTPAPDTTSDLNRASERASRQGRDMDRAPMPFR